MLRKMPYPSWISPILPWAGLAVPVSVAGYFVYSNLIVPNSDTTTPLPGSGVDNRPGPNPVETPPSPAPGLSNHTPAKLPNPTEPYAVDPTAPCGERGVATTVRKACPPHARRLQLRKRSGPARDAQGQ